MRTTLTLDPDVAIRLQKARRERDLPFKVLVNEALRRGLDQMDAPRPSAGTYRTEPWDLGRCRLPNLDDVAAVLDWADGENRR